MKCPVCEGKGLNQYLSPRAGVKHTPLPCRACEGTANLKFKIAHFNLFKQAGLRLIGIMPEKHHSRSGRSHMLVWKTTQGISVTTFNEELITLPVLLVLVASSAYRKGVSDARLAICGVNLDSLYLAT